MDEKGIERLVSEYVNYKNDIIYNHNPYNNKYLKLYSLRAFRKLVRMQEFREMYNIGAETERETYA